MNPGSRRLTILISGRGSNMMAFFDAIEAGLLNAEIAEVISNRPDAAGLAWAAQRKVATRVIDHRQFATRELFDAQLAQTVAETAPDAVILAGFMRILTPTFVLPFQGRLFNIHPSLLPKYPGLNTHRRAIEADDAEAGASVHFVTPELDGGPVLLQARVPVLPEDSPEELADRVLPLEHQIYPAATQLFLDGRLTLGNNASLLDGTPLPAGGLTWRGSIATTLE